MANLQHIVQISVTREKYRSSQNCFHVFESQLIIKENH